MSVAYWAVRKVAQWVSYSAENLAPRTVGPLGGHLVAAMAVQWDIAWAEKRADRWAVTLGRRRAGRLDDCLAAMTGAEWADSWEKYSVAATAGR
jgi:hypothetical protein